MAVWRATPAETLALAAGGFWLGTALHARLPLLDRWHIPRPITGGLVLACIVMLLRQAGVDCEFDTVLRDVLMTAFFTCVGLNASVALLRRGSGQVLICLALAVVWAVAQNIVGVGMSLLLGLHPLTGIMAGAATLAGGPATGLAFSGRLGEKGLPEAATLGLACAVFGILVGGVAGGYVGGLLVRRHSLRGVGAATDSRPKALQAGDRWWTMAALVASMGLGSLLSRGIEQADITLPGYIGSMIVAAVIRYVDDRGRCRVDEECLGVVSRVSLSLFIVMALLTIRLWVLASLALPLLALLAVQVVLTCLFAIWVVWRRMGSDYEGAVSAAGWTGFMIGTTANGVASMDALTSKYGSAPRAYTAVPVVGAFLIDFTNSFVIATSADLVHRLLL